MLGGILSPPPQSVILGQDKHLASRSKDATLCSSGSSSSSNCSFIKSPTPMTSKLLANPFQGLRSGSFLKAGSGLWKQSPVTKKAQTNNRCQSVGHLIDLELKFQSDLDRFDKGVLIPCKELTVEDSHRFKKLVEAIYGIRDKHILFLKRIKEFPIETLLTNDKLLGTITEMVNRMEPAYKVYCELFFSGYQLLTKLRESLIKSREGFDNQDSVLSRESLELFMYKPFEILMTYKKLVQHFHRKDLIVDPSLTYIDSKPLDQLEVLISKSKTEVSAYEQMYQLELELHRANQMIKLTDKFRKVVIRSTFSLLDIKWLDNTIAKPQFIEAKPEKIHCILLNDQLLVFSSDTKGGNLIDKLLIQWSSPQDVSVIQLKPRAGDPFGTSMVLVVRKTVAFKVTSCNIKTRDLWAEKVTNFQEEEDLTILSYQAIGETIRELMNSGNNNDKTQLSNIDMKKSISAPPANIALTNNTNPSSINPSTSNLNVANAIQGNGNSSIGNSKISINNSNIYQPINQIKSPPLISSRMKAGKILLNRGQFEKNVSPPLLSPTPSSSSSNSTTGINTPSSSSSIYRNDMILRSSSTLGVNISDQKGVSQFLSKPCHLLSNDGQSDTWSSSGIVSVDVRKFISNPSQLIITSSSSKKLVLKLFIVSNKRLRIVKSSTTDLDWIERDGSKHRLLMEDKEEAEELISVLLEEQRSPNSRLLIESEPSPTNSTNGRTNPKSPLSRFVINNPTNTGNILTSIDPMRNYSPSITSSTKESMPPIEQNQFIKSTCLASVSCKLFLLRSVDYTWTKIGTSQLMLYQEQKSTQVINHTQSLAKNHDIRLLVKAGPKPEDPQRVHLIPGSFRCERLGPLKIRVVHLDQRHHSNTILLQLKSKAVTQSLVDWLI